MAISHVLVYPILLGPRVPFKVKTSSALHKEEPLNIYIGLKLVGTYLLRPSELTHKFFMSHYKYM